MSRGHGEEPQKRDRAENTAYADSEAEVPTVWRAVRALPSGWFVPSCGRHTDLEKQRGSSQFKEPETC